MRFTQHSPWGEQYHGDIERDNRKHRTCKGARCRCELGFAGMCLVGYHRSLCRGRLVRKKRSPVRREIFLFGRRDERVERFRHTVFGSWVWVWSGVSISCVWVVLFKRPCRLCSSLFVQYASGALIEPELISFHLLKLACHLLLHLLHVLFHLGLHL